MSSLSRHTRAPAHRHTGTRPWSAAPGVVLSHHTWPTRRMPRAALWLGPAVRS